MGDPASTFNESLQRLHFLNSNLPDTVRLAAKPGIITDIYDRVVLPASDPYNWETFNQFLDALFGSDLRNSDGRLHNVQRGPFGMDLVIDYMQKSAAAGQLPYDIAILKITRLIEELEELTYAPI